MAVVVDPGYIQPMRLSVAVVVAIFVVVGSGLSSEGCTCGPVLPDPPIACVTATGQGCLPDEQCVDGACVPLGRCEADADCPSIAFRCVFPAQFCELRAGFGEECSETAPCAAGNFCSLGTCRPAAEAQPCATRLDCSPGSMCDKLSFFCVEEAPCSFATLGYPETACDAEESCTDDGACRAQCQGLCTPETEEQDCGAGLRCDGACRCVQCLDNADCGAGLVCNIRSGRCQSENLCFSDDDCDQPLVCDARTALCQVPPPPCDDDFDCPVAEICNLAAARCELPGGACFDDRFEDADTPATAEDLALLVDVPKLFDDLVLCPDDDDVYRFELLAGDRLTATVTGTLPQARATVWLLDRDAETSVAFSETPPRGDGRLVYTAQRDESVFLRVNALVAQTPYDLDTVITRASTCAADFFEGGDGANNDVIATATPPLLVPLGVPLQAEVCPDDTDVFAVDLAAGEGLQASLAFDRARADLDVAIVDAVGDVLANGAGIEQPEVVQRRLFDGGRVYVRVRGFANSNGAYTLTLARLAPVGCTDALEAGPDPLVVDDTVPRLVVVPNVDGAGGATPLVQERGLCRGGALPDVDRWAVDVEDFERLVVTATAETGLRLRLTIEDAAGVVLAVSPIGQGGAAVSLDARGPETLFVRAASPGGQLGSYTVRLSKENQGSCPVDAREPNNSVATRGPLPAVDEVVSICESDEDFYVLRGTAGKKATVDLTFAHGDADLDVQVLGLDGVQILATADSSSDNEHLEALLPLDGDYTVRVFSLSSGARARYFVRAVVESPQP
jgi:hypothetical protein